MKKNYRATVDDLLDSRKELHFYSTSEEKIWEKNRVGYFSYTIETKLLFFYFIFEIKIVCAKRD